MKERPIIFSAPMVRAILEGRKTQTRRVVKPQPDYVVKDAYFTKGLDVPRRGNDIKCPYGQPGDRLWVRETFSQCVNLGVDRNGEWPKDLFSYSYRATDGLVGDRWKPSIHMPRLSSRILLEIVSVRVERLQDISEADAKAEGADPYRLPCHPKREKLRHVDGFSLLWKPINGSESWDANPWVWVVEFRRVAP